MDCRFDSRSAVWVFFALLFVVTAPLLLAQTVATGNIAGTVVDNKGKPIAGARIEIISVAKASPIHVETSSAGWYSSGPIQPGSYSERIDVKGYHTVQLTVAVHVGNTETANVKLQPQDVPPPRIVAIPEGRRW